MQKFAKGKSGHDDGIVFEMVDAWKTRFRRTLTENQQGKMPNLISKKRERTFANVRFDLGTRDETGERGESDDVFSERKGKE